MRLLAGTLLIVLALVAAGCGGGGSSESAGDETTTVEETTTETTESVATETATATTSDDTETTATNADDLASLLGSEECASLIGLSAQIAQSMGGASSSSESFEETQKFFDGLADKAPEEIRDDFAVMAEVWTKIADAYANLDLQSGEMPSQETLEKLAAIGNEFDTAEVEEASTNIEAWVNENCDQTND